MHKHILVKSKTTSCCISRLSYSSIESNNHPWKACTQ